MCAQLTTSLSGSVPVCLAEIPITIRRFYGKLLLDRAIKEMEPMAALEFAGELHRAVEAPSEKMYYVSSEARQRVLG